MSAGGKPKRERYGRARRRSNGMAQTAGLACGPREEPLTRTLTILNAALRAWEARHGYSQFRSVWQRRSQA